MNLDREKKKVDEIKTEIGKTLTKPIYGEAEAPELSKNRLSPRMLTVVSLAVALALGFMAPQARILLTLISWLATWGHEMSHAITGLLTGARVTELYMMPNGSGATGTLGGAKTLIAWVGYPGGLLWGAAIWRLGDQARKWLMITMALLIGLSGLLWARMPITLLVLLGIIALVTLPRLLPWPTVAAVLMRVVGAVIFFFGWWRIWELWFLTVPNDAAILELLTKVPAVVWIGSWHAFGVLVTIWLVQGELKCWRTGKAAKTLSWPAVDRRKGGGESAPESTPNGRLS